MKLRTTEERDTYAYATSPINFAGLDKEDMFILMLPLVVSNSILDSPLLACLIGGFCLWFYKQLTAGHPQGHLVLRASLAVGTWSNSKFGKKYAPLRVVLKFFNWFLKKIWLNSGLLPSPTYCNRYEP